MPQCPLHLPKHVWELEGQQGLSHTGSPHTWPLSLVLSPGALCSPSAAAACLARSGVPEERAVTWASPARRHCLASCLLLERFTPSLAITVSPTMDFESVPF